MGKSKGRRDRLLVRPVSGAMLRVLELRKAGNRCGLCTLPLHFIDSDPQGAHMSSLELVAGRQARFASSGLPAGSTVARQMSQLVSAHLQRHQSGVLLRTEGEENGSVYIALAGWLGVSRSTLDGNRLINDVILPGDMIDPASANAQTSAVEIEALTNVTCAAIPRAKWVRVVNQSPELREVVHQESGATLTRMSGRMLRMGKSDAESIIAYALCELALRSTGRALEEVGSFQLPLTQQQLGDFCGLSSVHICRTLRRLRRNGVLDVCNHVDVTLQDVDALAEIAQIDPESLRAEIMPRIILTPPLSHGQKQRRQGAGLARSTA